MRQNYEALDQTFLLDHFETEITIRHPAESFYSLNVQVTIKQYAVGSIHRYPE